MVSVVSIVKPGFPAVVSGKDVILGVLPFYHIYGKFYLSRPITCQLTPITGAVKLIHFPLSLGIPVVIMPKFDPVEFCSNIEKYSITGALVVPPILLGLTHHPGMYILCVITLLFNLPYSNFTILHEDAQVSHVRYRYSM